MQKALIIRRKIRKAKVTASASFILPTILLLAFDARLTVSRYTAESNKIAGPIRLALVADLHSSDYGENQVVLLDAIEDEHQKLLCLAEIFLTTLNRRVKLLNLSRGQRLNTHASMFQATTSSGAEEPTILRLFLRRTA
jgi:hypothetical protein